MLSHKVIEFKKMGRVVWCARRNLFAVAQSMTLGGFGTTISWEIMGYFKDEFPDDPIWDKISYDGRQDVWYNYLHYNYLLCLVRQYFARTKFKSDVTSVILEDMPFYFESRSKAEKNPIKEVALKRLKKAMRKNESACLGTS
jgi:hypothetical protein